MKISFCKLINYLCKTPCIEIACLWHLNSDTALHMNFKAQVKIGECIFWKEKKGNGSSGFCSSKITSS